MPRERSVGLGVMGFHSFLQSQQIPFESVMAKVWNKRMFKHIKDQADKASAVLADERGACPDAAEYGIHERFLAQDCHCAYRFHLHHLWRRIARHRAGGGQCLHPQTLSGSYPVRNPYLADVLTAKG